MPTKTQPKNGNGNGHATKPRPELAKAFTNADLDKADDEIAGEMDMRHDELPSQTLLDRIMPIVLAEHSMLGTEILAASDSKGRERICKNSLAEARISTCEGLSINGYPHELDVVQKNDGGSFGERLGSIPWSHVAAWIVFNYPQPHQPANIGVQKPSQHAGIDKILRDHRASKTGSQSTSKASESTKSPQELTAVQELGEEDVDVASLARHSQNRVPTNARIEQKRASMAEHGLLERIVIRRRGGAYADQIVSGETRWLAAKKLGWKTIKAKVIACDDTMALILLAKYNADRDDLNVIEKAELIVQLCKPIDQGGAGHTRELAAKDVGLDSASSASNLVRLLELPEVWRNRIAAGELQQTFGREILRIIKVPKAMEELEKNWAGAKKRREPLFESRQEVVHAIKNLLRNHTRRLDETRYYNEWQHNLPRGSSGDYKCLLDLNNAAIAASLQLVELDVPSDDGKSVKTQVALNVKAFDKQQLDAIKRNFEAKQKKKTTAAGKSADKAEAKERTLTPAERKAAAAKKSEQLAKRVKAWRHEWVRSLCAERIARLNEDDPVLLKFAIWILSCCEPRTDGSLRNRLVRNFGGKPGGYHVEIGAVWKAFDHLEEMPMMVALRNLCCQSLYIESSNEDFPLIPHVVVDGLAADLGLASLEDEWWELQERAIKRDTAADGSSEQERYKRFFALHQTDQVEELATELGVDVSQEKGKQAKIDRLIATKGLPLPQSIKPVVAAAKRSAKKKGAK